LWWLVAVAVVAGIPYLVRKQCPWALQFALGNYLLHWLPWALVKRCYFYLPLLASFALWVYGAGLVGGTPLATGLQALGGSGVAAASGGFGVLVADLSGVAPASLLVAMAVLVA